MKKVIIYLLVLTLALGGIVFAHAAVTANQTVLLVYPTLQVGDPGVLAGSAAQLTFGCADHLRWHTDYTFSGTAVTEFSYSREPIQEPADYSSSQFDVYLLTAMSSSVSGGSLSLTAGDYSPLLLAVAAETPQNGSRTMEVQMSDYVNYYLPDFELHYEDGQIHCSELCSPYGIYDGRSWYSGTGCYRSLMEAFRFPVQPGHSMSVTMDKDDMGRVVGLELSSENGPELRFISKVTDRGVWFVPVFRDESGTALPYESPAGHGMYFIPWKTTDSFITVNGQNSQAVTLDVKKAELCFPLAEDLCIESIRIDTELGECWILSRTQEHYVLTARDLQSGAVLAELAVLPFDNDNPDRTASFVTDEGYILVTAQDKLALVDMASRTQVFSAPDVTDQTFGARLYDPDTGDLSFDHGLLVLTDTVWHREGTFWAAAWRQGWNAFYGEYDCSIMRGNDDWYYSYVTAEAYPVILK